MSNENPQLARALADYHIPELVRLNALPLSQAIHAREVSCREVMAAYLDHIETVNPVFNAIISLRDGDNLMAEADACDRQLDRGESRGWLHGIPQAIKDLAVTAGIPSTFGSPLLKDNIPEQDGIMVSRMRRDGAIFIGKTNTPEFGLGSQTHNPVFGATRNGHDLSRTSGGSSGGAAVSLITRMLPVADGSDFMGSLRNPSAFNNIFGFRPSFGRVPQGPVLDVFGHQLATEGPMGRTVTDVARLLVTQSGPDPRFPLSLSQDLQISPGELSRDFTGKRIGWLGDLQGYLPMEDGVLALCEEGLRTFVDMGCRVEEAILGFAPEKLWQSWLVLRHWAMAGALMPFYQDPEKRRLLKPEACWEVENGLKLSAMDVHDANMIRTDWYHSFRLLFQQYDYLVLPSAQVFPFPHELPWPKSIAGRNMDTYHRWMEVVVPASLSGCPVISVPAGFNANGMPMGMQIIGPPRADLEVLQLAHVYELATGDWISAVPPTFPESPLSRAE